jgi:hypothetical protein
MRRRMPLDKFRRVAAFWDPQDDWFLFSLGCEITVQFLAQQSGLSRRLRKILE